jgi:hypothetical protein
MINPENYAGHNLEFRKVHTEMILYHLRAICTDKGIKYLEGSLIYQNIV